jgi:hypothetical protein
MLWSCEMAVCKRNAERRGFFVGLLGLQYCEWSRGWCKLAVDDLLLGALGTAWVMA